MELALTIIAILLSLTALLFSVFRAPKSPKSDIAEAEEEKTCVCDEYPEGCSHDACLHMGEEDKG